MDTGILGFAEMPVGVATPGLAAGLVGVTTGFAAGKMGFAAGKLAFAAATEGLVAAAALDDVVGGYTVTLASVKPPLVELNCLPPTNEILERKLFSNVSFQMKYPIPWSSDQDCLIGRVWGSWLDRQRFPHLLVKVDHLVVFCPSDMSFQPILIRADNIAHFTIERTLALVLASKQLLLSKLLLVNLTLKVSLLGLQPILVKYSHLTGYHITNALAQLILHTSQ